MVVTVADRPFAVMGFTVSGGRMVEMDAIADPARVGGLAAGALSHWTAAPTMNRTAASRHHYAAGCDNSST